MTFCELHALTLTSRGQDLGVGETPTLGGIVEAEIRLHVNTCTCICTFVFDLYSCYTTMRYIAAHAVCGSVGRAAV